MKTLLLAFATLAFAALPQLADADQAGDTTIAVAEQNPGATPFINNLTLVVSDLTVLQRVKFSISPKSGSVTRPLSATYTVDYLAGRGYVDPQTQRIIVPVFGLYAGYTNNVTLSYSFADGSSKSADVTVPTQPFDDACNYDTPIVLQPRTNTKDLSYDFILITSTCSPNSPTVIDTDGAVRWVGTAGVSHYVATFFDNAVYLANGGVLRIDLDGTVTRVADLTSLGAFDLHHNMDPGKRGLILDINTDSWVESVNVEIDPAGNILKKWLLGDIIRQAMVAGGDDPTEFVRNANGRYDFHAHEDWFHNNSVAYRRADDSLIISSRENFVICLDYESSAIKWILGDPTKQWYQYPSLRQYALALSPGTHPPIGQHSVSVTKDDHLLLFDNGQPSQNHSPFGASRGYSAPRKYALDLTGRVATEVWNFVTDPTVFAPFRSSVYEDAPLNYLMHYDLGNQRVLGFTASGEKVFDYRYDDTPGYRSIPVHWENLSFPPTDARLANISARSTVKSGDGVNISGFIVSGNGQKKIVVRGLGPSLQVGGQPVPGRLMDPALELHNSSGDMIGANDNYKNGPDAAAIEQAGLAPNDDNEAALLANLSPGTYTAVLRGANETTGIGLAEVFDLDLTNGSQLANLSTRALTSSGDDVLIGGVILTGSTPKRLLLRAVGPELAGTRVSNPVQDPTLTLYGADGVKINENDNWRDASNAVEIEATGVAPSDDRESAILMPLPSGTYTFIVRGKDSVEAPALVEAYRLD